MLFHFIFQAIFDIGTYEELLERRTIPDYLYSDDSDDELAKSTPHRVSSSTDVTSSNGNGNGISTNPFRKQMDDEQALRRNRRRSIHKFIQEQHSIEDDIGKGSVVYVCFF